MAVLPPPVVKGALIALFCSPFILFSAPATPAHGLTGNGSPAPSATASAPPTTPPTGSTGQVVPSLTASAGPAATIDDRESTSGASALLLVGFSTIALISLAMFLLTLRRERPDNTR
ncbi:hypothetical protein AB0K21_21030 [Streptosporangium sp. NPDC049248]|uniref:hypothetical protein n=1 Tax=Streptosporangium sp. NPDC049248 TaxID=3155651 RepID=UPI003414BE47